MKNFKKFIQPLTIAIIFGILTFGHFVYSSTKYLWQRTINTEVLNEEIFQPPVNISLIELKNRPTSTQEINDGAIFWEIAKNSTIGIMLGTPKSHGITITFFKSFGESALAYREEFKPEPPQKSSVAFHAYVADSHKIENNRIIFGYHWKRDILGGTTLVLLVGILISGSVMFVIILLAEGVLWLVIKFYDGIQKLKQD